MNPIHTAIRLSPHILTQLFPTICEAQIRDAQNNGWLLTNSDPYCSRCGTTVAAQAVTDTGCCFCHDKTIRWNQMVRLGSYSQPWRQWALSMKFAGQWSWSAWFGQQLGKMIRDPDHHHPVAVCPVPMHWRRRICRGYNQADLIAHALARHQRWPLARILKRLRYTKPQTKVQPSQRANNVRGSIGIIPVDLTGWIIWLVDDIKTTGATLSECTSRLYKAGAYRVNTAVAAVTDPKYP